MCATARQASATEVLRAVHRILASASESAAYVMSEVYFNYLGDAARRFRTGAGYETPPGLGHALELRVYRTEGRVHVDWWYDTSRFEAHTVEELTEQFPRALYEMTSDAVAPV